MQLNSNHSRRLFALVFILTFSLVAIAQSHPRLMWPTGVYPDRFAGSVTGFESIWSNPAGLGGIRGMEFVSMFDQRDPGFGDDLGYALAVKGLGYSYRRLIDVSGDVDFREHIFAAGFSGNGSFSLGASYRYLTEAPDGLNKSHTWNIGALYRTDPRWSIGAMFNNLNKHKLSNQKSPVEITTGIGIRPLGTSQLTLSGEFSMSHEQSLKDAVFRYGAEGSPMHGLILYSLFDDESHYEIGARINFTNSFFGAQARMTDGDYQNATFYVGASAVRQESIVASRKRTLAMSIKGDIEENPVQPLFGSQKPPFFSYVSAIHRAAVDPSVTALVIRIGQSNLSWAHMQELKNAIDHFTSEGKPAQI